MVVCHRSSGDFRGTNIYSLRRDSLVPSVQDGRYDVFPDFIHMHIMHLNRYRVYGIHRIGHILPIILLQL